MYTIDFFLQAVIVARMKTRQLPFHPDSAELYLALQELPWPVLLDSCQPMSEQGRYDIISAYPAVRLTTCNGVTTIETPEGVQYDQRDPFVILNQYLPTISSDQSLPFFGGAIGFFSYDLARTIEPLPQTAHRQIDIPDMMIAIYDWAIVVDHHTQQSQLVQADHYPLSEQQLQTILQRCENIAAKPTTPFTLTRDWQANMSAEQYREKFAKVQQYIKEGDCYQVNLTQCFAAEYHGDPFSAYRQLRAINPAPYSAFMSWNNHHVLSFSPERFLKISDQQVETKPMKGTRRRGKTAEQDHQLAQELLNSEKDRAENLMIVDLLRNDIGRVCQPGSIRVPTLIALESFPAVHHLVSTVKGRLQAPYTSVDCLRACFPGGSITGAPKIRAMQIIEELEPTRRGLYCGSLGYISFDGQMDSNICIRTLVADDKHLYCAAGGALVADSVCEEEYQETFDKVNVLLESIRSL